MLATIAYSVIAGFQLVAMNKQIAIMSGTLEEARRSGAQSTDQMWQAIGNVNWMARSVDQSSKDTLVQMKGQSQTLQRSVESVVATNRPWIVPGPPPQHKRVINEANLEWHNAGKTPAVSVFSSAEYFIGPFPHHLRSCPELEKELRKKPVTEWQYRGFVPQDGPYETGLANTPKWDGPAPLNIHGCVWYTDIVSNKERTTEFFYMAVNDNLTFPKSGDGITLYWLSDYPIIYR